MSAIKEYCLNNRDWETYDEEYERLSAEFEEYRRVNNES